MRIIPFGYSTPNAQATLDRLMEGKRAALIDIRHTPYSKRPEWRQEALEARYGTRYRHVPSLGNVNHANGGEIRLANAAQGIPFLLDGLHKGYTLIVMCTCQSFEQCHRRIVVDLVKAALPEVEIVLDEATQGPGDIVVTVPQSFGLDTWIDEGDPAGAEWSGEEWHYYLGGNPPDIKPGARVYVVYKGTLRGYSPLVRIDRFPDGRYGLVRHGNAVAVTIPEYIPGFRGFRYRWWLRDLEVPFPDWQNPDAVPPGRPHEVVLQGAKPEPTQPTPEKKTFSVKDFWTAQDTTQRDEVLEALKPVPYKTRCVIEVDGKVI